MKNITTLIICFTAIYLTGCTTMLKAPQVDMSALKPPGPVTTVVAAWEPAVSNGENSMRGFAGRVYLYDQEMIRPVKAKGMIVVYLFDEDDRLKGDERPNEGIVFNAKTLNSSGVYKKSKLGHSYNLWVPVDAAGPDGRARNISLIVRYIPEKGGASKTSTQTTARLPGRSDKETMIALSDWQLHTESGSIQQASARHFAAERVIESNAARPLALQAVTIR